MLLNGSNRRLSAATLRQRTGLDLALIAHSQRVVIARIAQVDGSNGSMTAVLRLVLAYPLSYRLWLHHFFGCGKALEDVHEA